MFPVILVRLVRISAYLSQGGAGPRHQEPGFCQELEEESLLKKRPGEP